MIHEPLLEARISSPRAELALSPGKCYTLWCHILPVSIIGAASTHTH